jgi:hypothetical protein
MTMTEWGGWSIEMVLIVALAVFFWRRSTGVDALGRAVREQSRRLQQLEQATARIEAQIEGALKETHASRAAVRRVEDYLLDAKRRTHDDDI